MKLLLFVIAITSFVLGCSSDTATNVSAPQPLLAPTGDYQCMDNHPRYKDCCPIGIECNEDNAVVWDIDNATCMQFNATPINCPNFIVAKVGEAPVRLPDESPWREDVARVVFAENREPRDNRTSKPLCQGPPQCVDTSAANLQLCTDPCAELSEYELYLHDIYTGKCYDTITGAPMACPN